MTGQNGAVALSGDGNTAIVGGLDGQWIFTQSGGVWTQQGPQLVDAGAIDGAQQGFSVALSGNGDTAISGGPGDNDAFGAAWVFVRRSSTGTHDFNGDLVSDLLWADTGGDVAMWLMNGSEIAQAGLLGNVGIAWSVVGQRDFNGDGIADILWRDTSTGAVAIWFMNGLQVASTAGLGNIPTNWSIVGTGDLNGDGDGDLLWRDSNTGAVAAWFMSGSTVTATAAFGTVPLSWTIVGDDNNGNVFWRDTAGDLAIWQVSGQEVVSANIGNTPGNWVIAGLGDFNGDGLTDYLWRDTNSGTVAVWFTVGTGTQILSSVAFGAVPSAWSIAQTGDYNGDGYSDILWVDNTGNVAIWFMNGPQIASTAGYGVVTGLAVQSANAE
jgi:hypothetical protein